MIEEEAEVVEEAVEDSSGEVQAQGHSQEVITSDKIEEIELIVEDL